MAAFTELLFSSRLSLFGSWFNWSRCFWLWRILSLRSLNILAPSVVWGRSIVWCWCYHTSKTITNTF